MAIGRARLAGGWQLLIDNGGGCGQNRRLSPSLVAHQPVDLTIEYSTAGKRLAHAASGCQPPLPADPIQTGC